MRRLHRRLWTTKASYTYYRFLGPFEVSKSFEWLMVDG
jgi:hypothetical protein